MMFVLLSDEEGGLCWNDVFQNDGYVINFQRDVFQSMFFVLFTNQQQPMS